MNFFMSNLTLCKCLIKWLIACDLCQVVFQSNSKSNKHTKLSLTAFLDSFFKCKMFRKGTNSQDGILNKSTINYLMPKANGPCDRARDNLIKNKYISALGISPWSKDPI